MYCELIWSDISPCPGCYLITLSIQTPYLAPRNVSYMVTLSSDISGLRNTAPYLAIYMLHAIKSGKEWCMIKVADKQMILWIKKLHWSKRSVILMKFLSLAALEVVKMTTSSAASDENFVEITFLYQWWRCELNGIMYSSAFIHDWLLFNWMIGARSSWGN